MKKPKFTDIRSCPFLNNIKMESPAAKRAREHGISTATISMQRNSPDATLNLINQVDWMC